MRKKVFFIFCYLSPLLTSAASHSNAVSLEEYDNLETPSVPTVFSYVSPTTCQRLSYVGICHDTNPKNSQYVTLERQWRAFLAGLDDKAPVAVICEMLPDDDNHSSYTDKTAAIAHGGDCGYAVWIGKTHGCAIIGAELPHRTVIQQLLQEFDRDMVYYFCFALAADFWTRYEEKPPLEPFILERVQQWTGDTSINFKDLAALHEKYTGKALGIPSRHFFIHLMTLTHHTSYVARALFHFSIPRSVIDVIYPILRRSHQLRDNHTFEVIREHWKARKHLFIVYGALHAVALKKALKRLTQH